MSPLLLCCAHMSYTTPKLRLCPHPVPLTSLERPEDSITVWIQLHEGRCNAVNVNLRDPLTMNVRHGHGV